MAEGPSSDELIRQARASLPVTPSALDRRTLLRRRKDDPSPSALLVEQSRAMYVEVVVPAPPGGQPPAVPERAVPEPEVPPRRATPSEIAAGLGLDTEWPAPQGDARERPAQRTRRSGTPPDVVVVDRRSDETASGRARRPARSSRFGGLLLLVVLGIIAASLIGTVAGRIDPDGRPVAIEAPTATLPDLALGLDASLAIPAGSSPACHDLDDTGALEPVPCEQLHDYERIGWVVVTATEYPGTDALDDSTTDSCISGLFEQFVGVEYSVSVWWLRSFPPSEAEWAAGERRAECVIYRKTGDGAGIDTVTGSARGSAE